MKTMTTSIIRSGWTAHIGALFLFLVPLISWVAEFVTATAWSLDV